MNLIKEKKFPIDMIIDSDAANETDDQFAICYALAVPEKFHVLAIHAAPFFHCRVTTPEEGMVQSVLEIQRILHFFPHQDCRVCRGAVDFLHENTPCDSEAVRNLIACAGKYTPERPLHVVAIAALTNIASALMIAPEIADKIVIDWLGSHSYRLPPSEFNLEQDFIASATVFNSNVRLNLFPCLGVAESLKLTPRTAGRLLSDAGGLGDFLYDRFMRQYRFSFGENSDGSDTLSIWDIAPFAALLDLGLAHMEMEPHRQLCIQPLAWRLPERLRYDQVCGKLEVEPIFSHFKSMIDRHHNDAMTRAAAPAPGREAILGV